MTGRATPFSTAPVAYHRLVFRRHQKDQLLRTANAPALMGLAAVAFSISGTVLPATSAALTGLAVPLIATFTLAVFGGLWLVLPMWRAKPELDKAMIRRWFTTSASGRSTAWHMS